MYDELLRLAEADLAEAKNRMMQKWREYYRASEEYTQQLIAVERMKSDLKTKRSD